MAIFGDDAEGEEAPAVENGESKSLERGESGMREPKRSLGQKKREDQKKIQKSVDQKKDQKSVEQKKSLALAGNKEVNTIVKNSARVVPGKRRNPVVALSWQVPVETSTPMKIPKIAYQDILNEGLLQPYCFSVEGSMAEDGIPAKSTDQDLVNRDISSSLLKQPESAAEKSMVHEPDLSIPLLNIVRRPDQTFVTSLPTPRPRADAPVDLFVPATNRYMAEKSIARSRRRGPRKQQFPPVSPLAQLSSNTTEKTTKSDKFELATPKGKAADKSKVTSKTTILIEPSPPEKQIVLVHYPKTAKVRAKKTKPTKITRSEKAQPLANSPKRSIERSTRRGAGEYKAKIPKMRQLESSASFVPEEADAFQLADAPSHSADCPNTLKAISKRIPALKNADLQGRTITVGNRRKSKTSISEKRIRNQAALLYRHLLQTCASGRDPLDIVGWRRKLR